MDISYFSPVNDRLRSSWADKPNLKGCGQVIDPIEIKQMNFWMSPMSYLKRKSAMHVHGTSSDVTVYHDSLSCRSTSASSQMKTHKFLICHPHCKDVLPVLLIVLLRLPTLANAPTSSLPYHVHEDRFLSGSFKKSSSLQPGSITAGHEPQFWWLITEAMYCLHKWVKDRGWCHY